MVIKREKIREVKVIGFKDRLTPMCKGNITILSLNHWAFSIVERESERVSMLFKKR